MRITPALLVGTLAWTAATVPAQTPTYRYTPQVENAPVRYTIEARLEPETKTVRGRYTLTWRNPTDDSVPDLWFHLYLNAFKNLDSTWMRERDVRRRPEPLREWKADPDESKWGWVDVDRISIAHGADLTPTMRFMHPDDDNEKDQTVMRVELPQPVPPRGTVTVEVEFTSKLPRALARTGWAPGEYFLISQWFPKLGVYESAARRRRKYGAAAGALGAWNCRQFHANAEFYADYGAYDVELTVPERFVIGATGVEQSRRRNPDGTATYRYFQEDVHDFAWTASPRFVKLRRLFEWGKEVRGDEVVHWSRFLAAPAEQLALRDVEVILLIQPEHRGQADRYFAATFAALKYYGLGYGRYPYDTLTVVDPPRKSNTGGMEYPTLFTGGTAYWPGARSGDPEGVTVHEAGHQFWYGLVGNNEFEDAWLDEGLNTYSTGKVMERAFPDRCNYQRVFGVPVWLYPWLEIRLPQFPFAGVGKLPLGLYFSCVSYPERTERRPGYLPHAKSDDVVRFGWEYLDGPSYTVNSYGRVALTLRTLESYLGEEVMARAMRAYFQRFQYQHAIPQDFFATMSEASGQDLDGFFREFFYSSNVVDYAVTDIQVSPLFGPAGVYDEDGRKTVYDRDRALEEFEKSEEKRWRSTVVVRRLGEARAPVDILVTFDNGEEVREHWNGQYRWLKLVYERPQRVKSAAVDPEHKLALDANFTNNSRVREPDHRAAARWSVRWIFWLQNLLFAASFFS
jgi:hypothetical protein